MSTKVTQTYTSSLNLSLTVKDGVVTKVTTWVTGVSGSTDRPVDLPRKR